MANKVIIDIEARLVDKISSEANKAKKSIDQLNKTNAKPKVSLDDSRFSQKLNRTNGLLRRLGNTKATAVLDAMDRASTKINSLRNKADAFASRFIARLGIDPGNTPGTINKVKTGLKEIAGRVWRGTLKIADYATAPIRKITNALFSLKSIFMGVATAMATKKLIFEPINLADAYSGAKIGFSTLLGETAGQEMMNQLDEFAKVTPFKTSGVIQNAQKMMAMGWDPERIIKDMEVIGNAAASTGKLDQGLESIVRALSQIKTKGKLSTEELNQLAEAGIAAKSMLAEGLGYGTGDSAIGKLSKDIEDGKIMSEQAIEALLIGMKRFDGMMDSMANETVEGLKSQLEDTFEINIARRWGQGLQDGAKRGLGYIVELLDEADSSLQRFGDTVHDVGKAIGNWAADKLQKAVERTKDITDSFEFKNASLGDKLKMLWRGVITDPLSEWWESSGREKTAKAAEKVGRGMATFLSTAIKGMLGMTDIFNETGMDESGGTSIAKSFARGFVDGFDVDGITDKLVQAINNVWGALPWWGKMLVGGYAGSKVIGGVGNIVRGVTAITGSAAAGSLGTSIAGGLGLSAGIGSGLGAGAVSGLGLGAGAGGLAMLYGAYDVGKSGVNAYRAYKAGNKTEGKANLAKGGTTAAYMATGAAIGTAVGGPVGTLIGGGIGTVVGLWQGSRWAKSIRKDAEAAKMETNELAEAMKNADSEAEKAEIRQKSVWENQRKHFGDIELSMDEISRLSSQIVFGDDQQVFDDFSSRVQQAEASLQSFKTAAASLDKWMWKAGLGVKFNDDEKESIIKSADEYISGAKAYLENKHYEFTASVAMFVDIESKDGKKQLAAGNELYGKLQKDLDKASNKLSKEMTKALKDGVINADEMQAINAAQQKIASITEKIANADYEAEVELLKVKFGGNITADSFANLQKGLQESIEKKMSGYEEGFTTRVSNLKLQLDEGVINESEYNKQLQDAISQYEAKVEELKVDVMGVQFDVLADSQYGSELGKDAKKKLESALTNAMKEGINPADWSVEDARRLLGVDSLSENSALAIGEYLATISDQMEIMNIDGELYIKLTANSNADEVQEQVQASIDEKLATKIEKEVGIDITGNKEIMNDISVIASEFGVPTEVASVVALMLTGDKQIMNQFSVICQEFGVDPSIAMNVINQLTGSKQIMNKLTVTKKDFGIDDVITGSVAVQLTARKVIDNTLEPWNEFRGGIVGYSNGGYVKGGGKLIRVAEEGDPEAIIPLSPRRRDRAMRLWEQTGKLLHADFKGYASGGFVGASEGRVNREAVQIGGGNIGGEQTIKIDVGGIELNVKVEGGQDVVEAIQSQKEELADEIAGIINRAIAAQYQNMPTKKGA